MVPEIAVHQTEMIGRAIGAVLRGQAVRQINQRVEREGNQEQGLPIRGDGRERFRFVALFAEHQDGGSDGEKAQGQTHRRGCHPKRAKHEDEQAEERRPHHAGQEIVFSAAQVNTENAEQQPAQRETDSHREQDAA